MGSILARGMVACLRITVFVLSCMKIATMLRCGQINNELERNRAPNPLKKGGKEGEIPVP